MSDRRLWKVAVPVPLRKTFTYEVPREIGAPEPGMRVLIPFGRRKLTGYLIAPLDNEETPSFKVRKVFSLLDKTPAIPSDLLDLLISGAEYYMHPVGEVFRTALPPGIDPSERKGDLLKPRVAVKRITLVSALPEAPDALNSMSKKAPRRAAVLTRLIERGEISIEELRSDFKDIRKHIKRLLDDNLVATKDADKSPDPFFCVTPKRDKPPQLTGEQRSAVDVIGDWVDKEKYRGFLLHGITGSGKTEVYLHAIERAHELGKGAIVLVPEITLTPQLVHRYSARFGSNIAVWHSALTERERFDQWQLLRSGKVKVAIGVRSALFAPVQNLGIIIVDEEHDGSFKQERGFPYSARDLALLRASKGGAVAILGSATPSLETYQNAKIEKLHLLELSSRPTAKPLPKVEIIDLSRHKEGPGKQSVISGPLHAAIEETLERKEQGILFLNRRGFAPSLICTACGQVVKCDDCAVSMTVHRRPRGLICHYCDARRSMPERCPSCAATDIKPIGAGTQKIEDLLADLFPKARVARLDRDTASGRSAEKVLNGLRDGEVDLLVGTQMVTKGHDFPNVTLVGVLLGDVGLHMPDFRAAERTFQLITQVAGRAGRSELEGRALIQTYSPDHPAIVLSQTHDYKSFAKEESLVRSELGYPPFGKLAALRLSGPDNSKVEAAARSCFIALRDAWHKAGKPPVAMLGPAPAPIPFLQARHRWRIMLRASRQDMIRRLLAEVINEIESPPAGVRIRLDIDPISML